jgi:MerR family redox-sensitive transcriptional activator SoxR
MKLLTIGDVARLTGLRPSALRYYERRGLLPAPARRNGRRQYSDAIVQQVALLRFVQRAGFTLAEAHALLHTAGARSDVWRRLARGKLHALDAQIAQLEQARRTLHEGLACRCDDLATCALVQPPADAATARNMQR